jgi:serine/threonine protein kinase
MSVLGSGAFGEVYLAKDVELDCDVAVKIENPQVKKPVLKVEIGVLKKLKGAEVPYICDFIAGGRFIAPHLYKKEDYDNEYPTYTYMVMSLLGPRYQHQI